jgi:hypothetical protein
MFGHFRYSSASYGLTNTVIMDDIGYLLLKAALEKSHVGFQKVECLLRPAEVCKFRNPAPDGEIDP